MYSNALSGVQGLLPPDTDWVYAKKREAQEIIPGLWLGPFGSARDQEFLKRVGITDALVVRAPEEARIICPKYPEFIRYEVRVDFLCMQLKQRVHSSCPGGNEAFFAVSGLISQAHVRSMHKPPESKPSPPS
ncbi:styx-b [Symbiodinium natans]|uniref:Styx-b protein n=1 Tax=Symbiodinium natans TaxID=878477 RepID=A0A812T0N7_9DINO|nr:styx-b [Symbiodinium natans]